MTLYKVEQSFITQWKRKGRTYQAEEGEDSRVYRKVKTYLLRISKGAFLCRGQTII